LTVCHFQTKRFFMRSCPIFMTDRYPCPAAAVSINVPFVIIL
jgi:hypothetical protein